MKQNNHEQAFEAGAFHQYLLQKNYCPSTIKGHLQNLGYFEAWVKASNLYEVENIAYNDLLAYIQYEQERNLSPNGINQRLGTISLYFEYLKQQNNYLRNPARTLRVKGQQKKITIHPLTMGEMELLYAQYKANRGASATSNGYVLPGHVRRRMALNQVRNTVMLGLLIYQGLHSGELQKLEVGHVNLRAGMIYIPSTSRSNSRLLALDSKQVLDLYAYLHEGVRDKLYGLSIKESPGAVNPAALLPGNMHNALQRLTQHLKGLCPHVRSSLYIRSCVIIHWLGQYGKREVQYRIGHRSIRSTEQYEQQQTDDLRDDMTRYHPFGK